MSCGGELFASCGEPWRAQLQPRRVEGELWRGVPPGTGPAGGTPPGTGSAGGVLPGTGPAGGVLPGTGPAGGVPPGTGPARDTEGAPPEAQALARGEVDVPPGTGPARDTRLGVRVPQGVALLPGTATPWEVSAGGAALVGREGV